MRPLVPKREGVLQRLFSTFAGGWPGIGLLLQRTLTATLLLRFGIIDLARTSFSLSIIPQIVGACAGTLPGIPVMLAALGATAAMIGPGAWSIDARLFGRKRIAI